jgi:hypothetical protein
MNIKKLISLTLLSMLLLVNQQEAKAQAFQQEDVIFSLGYGTPNLTKAVFKAGIAGENLNATVSGLGPLHVKVEYGISDKIGIGLSINHVSTNFDAQYLDDIDNKNYFANYNYNSTKFNLRTNFHFSNSDKLDAYWGFGVGYGIGSVGLSTNDPDLEEVDIDAGGLGLESTLGIRYFVTKNIGIYTEVGFAKSIIQFGLNYKL